MSNSRYNGGMSEASAHDVWTANEQRRREQEPLLTALRARVPDGDRGGISAIERCVLNADDEGFGGSLAEAALREFARTQAFFAAIAASTQAPHYGDQQRQVVNEILKRAIEAGLYSEPK